MYDGEITQMKRHWIVVEEQKLNRSSDILPLQGNYFRLRSSVRPQTPELNFVFLFDSVFFCFFFLVVFFCNLSKYAFDQ